MLRWPHAHHRDLRARLPAAPPTIDDTCLHQNRHLMIPAFRLRQRRAALPSRWSSTGCDETYPNAPCQQQNGPAMATPGGYLNCHLPLPPTRPIIVALEPIASRRTHHPPHSNPHSRVHGAFRAPSPAGSFLGGFRTTALVPAAPSRLAVIRNP